MNRLIKIEIRGGHFYSFWEQVAQVDGDTVSVRKIELSRGPTAETVNGVTLEQFLTVAPLFAELVKDNIIAERAAAKAAQEAARQAYLDWWNSLTPEEQAAEIAKNTPPPVIPDSLPRYKIKKWMVGKGINLDQIASALSSQAQKIWWYDVDLWNRNDAFLAALAVQKGFNVDTAFTEAASL